MRYTHRRHTRQRRGKLRTIVGKLSQPEPLLVFVIDIHRHDRDFVTWRQFGQLISHRFQNLGLLEKTAGAVFAQIENEYKRERLARLTFTPEVSDVARLAVVEHGEVVGSQIRNRETSFLV